MRRLPFYSLLTLFIALIYGCGTTEYLTSKRNINEVKNIVVFPPVTEISVIYKKDNPEKSELFSDMASKEIDLQLKAILPGTKRYYQFHSDSSQKEIIHTAIQLMNSVEGGRSIRGIKIPELLLQQLDSINEDFGLFVFFSGFTRAKENLTKEYVRRQGMALATIGIYQTVPNSAYSIMICFIVDRKNKNLAMYRKTKWKLRDPTDKLVVKSQLRDLLMRYFQSAK
ncbi:MAG: hypothetical protein ABIN94_08725 [Ferruginibacter sp.]